MTELKLENQNIANHFHLFFDLGISIFVRFMLTFEFHSSVQFEVHIVFRDEKLPPCYFWWQHVVPDIEADAKIG